MSVLNQFDLTGKTALVTGCKRGIGKAMAIGLAEAGADIIGGMLPKAIGSHRPAAVIRLRGRTDVGSTFLGIVERYRGETEAAGGVLLLAGVGPELRDQLERTGVLEAIGDDRVCEAQPTLTASVSVAVEAAEQAC